MEIPQKLNTKRNLLFFTDPHVESSSLEECKLIFDEIIRLCKQYNVTEIFGCGDTFDVIKPNAKELDLVSNFFKELNLPITIIAAQSHESTNAEETVLNHFGILNNQIKIITEYKEDKRLFVGHFIVKESKLAQFGATVSIQELKDFAFVVLGHSHHYEMVTPKIVQLGSCRWINFDEAKDKAKIILLAENFDSPTPKFSFLALKSPYPMVDIVLEKKLQNNPKEALQDTKINKTEGMGKGSNKTKTTKIAPINQVNLTEIDPISQIIAKLDSLTPKTKVRIIFRDYGLWRDFLPFYTTYEKKFIVFRQKKDFLTQAINLETKNVNKLKMKEALIKWMEQNKIENKIKTILLEEIK
jgi:DNA repair exonuclease SbcCD nuclease subunit